MYFDSAPEPEIAEGQRLVARAPRMMAILDAVSAVYRIGTRDIMSHSRLPNVVEARDAFYWVSRRIACRSLVSIGQFLNGRHHTTVMHGVEKVSRRFDKFKRNLVAVLAALGFDTDRLMEAALAA